MTNDTTADVSSAVLPCTASASITEIERLVKFAVSRHCRRVRCSPEARADLLQEGLIAGLQAASTYDSSKGSSNATWILRRVVGQIRDAYQRLRNHGVTHRPPGVFAIADSLITPTPSANSDDDDETDSVSELVDTALPVDEQVFIAASMDQLSGRLAPADRSLLSMFFAEDMSTREIASRMDLSHATVAIRLQRALDRARRALTPSSQEFTTRH